MIRVKSTSNDGIYYLVNGWEKNKAFWVKETDKRFNDITTFKTKGIAQRSLNHLLKLMSPDYDEDIIEFIEI